MTFRLEGNLSSNLQQMGPRIKRAMVASAQYVAPQAESFMKSQAPWTDRSGAARNGLRADVVVATNKVAIVLFHSVPYGVWLEIRFGGKWGIIPATMAAAGPLWVEAFARLAFDD